MTRRCFGLVLTLSIGGCVNGSGNGGGPQLIPVDRFDVSPAFRDIPPDPVLPGDDRGPDRPIKVPHPAAPHVDDPVVQNSMPAQATPATMNSFDGLGDGFTGPAGAFQVQAHPPDVNGDVGPHHFVQTVNISYAVFDKTGKALLGPVPINTLWKGFGGQCESSNDGDPVVVHDDLADRWVISQFAIDSTPDFQCVAVSTSADPTGSYYRYQFTLPEMNDYPKIGVWPDGYYMSYNMFGASNFDGAKLCALNRVAMLAGNPQATSQCFDTGANYGGALPSHLHGTTLPPAGSPNYIVAIDTNALDFWKFHVDWKTPNNSRLDGPIVIPVAAYNAYSGSATQPSGDPLDSLSDRAMYRFAYRKFADHESLLVNHAVDAPSGAAAVRWYELRNPSAAMPTVYQQGTWSPDGSNRWMGSISIDESGDIAVGYTVDSATLFPSIRYAGRLANDPLGQLAQGERSMVEGTTSQTGVSRWGDYSSMSVDPVDNCTFWYTGEYMTGNDWHTRIGSFKFPSCGTCTPSCGGKMCGSNGCGGSCGTCASGHTCSATGHCVCTPSCGGKMCGSNGCGGSCGTCPHGKTCNPHGLCVASCTPSCTGKTCGPNGCGGSCGICPSGKTCGTGGTCH